MAGTRALDRLSRRLPATGRGFLLLLVALIAGLVAVEQLAQWTRGGLASPSARWVWAPEEEGRASAVFVALRDFELAEPPTTARLTALADEEMQLYVNGALVTLRRFHPGDRPGHWEVAPLLRAGTNRLAAELRSGRGVGGFRASLVDGHGENLLVTDGEWRIARYSPPDLLDPGGYAGEERARVWSEGVGRWARTPERSLSPLFDELLVAELPRLPERVQVGGSKARWRDAAGFDWRTPPLGRWVAFDWGEPISGHLNVGFARTGGARALVWYGVERPDPATAPPDEYLLKLDGPRSWSSSEARRFRHAIVVSTSPVVGARAFEVDASQAAARVGPPGGGAGVFGLAPLALHAPVEDEIRRELERLAGVDGR